MHVHRKFFGWAARDLSHFSDQPHSYNKYTIKWILLASIFAVYIKVNFFVMDPSKLAFGASGPTLSLVDGINMEDLCNEKPQEIEFSAEQLDEQMTGLDMGNKLYFDDIKKMSYILDDIENSTDEKDSISWFKRVCKPMVNITSDGGVRKVIKKEGVGIVAVPGSRIRANYNGFLEDLDEPFDSSYFRSSPLEITLGKGGVIQGLDIGIATMRKHEIARFLIMPEYAYGAMGCPPRIPRNTPVLFEVELLSFSDSNILDNYEELSSEEKRNLPFARVIAVCNEMKSEGNQSFEQQNYSKAIKKYLRAVNILESATSSDENDERELIKSCAKAYVNMGLCNLKLGNFGKALAAGKKVLGWEKDNKKAIYICGKALRHLGDFSRSRSFLLRAHRLSPNSKDVAHELKTLDAMEVKFNLVERQICRRMFA